MQLQQHLSGRAAARPQACSRRPALICPAAAFIPLLLPQHHQQQQHQQQSQRVVRRSSSRASRVARVVPRAEPSEQQEHPFPEEADFDLLASKITEV